MAKHIIEVDFDDLAGECQTKAMQFSHLKQNSGVSQSFMYTAAINYIDDLMYELQKAKRRIKKIQSMEADNANRY